MDTIGEIRSFNRFYTREMGLLRPHLPASCLTLAEGRVLFELRHGDNVTAAEVARRLDMDKAQLSRILARFRRRRLAEARANPAHGRQKLLNLTAAGRRAFAELDRGTREQLERTLLPLGTGRRERLVAAVRAVRELLRDGGEAVPDQVRLRGVCPGDLGWVVHRQAVLYHREYSWDWTYEGLIARILGDFAASFDAAKEDGWIAERAGAVAGSVFLMRDEAPEAGRLRLLYVEPWARGRGIGERLVGACIDRARALGYRRLVLWTNSVLTAARRIYERAGFTLESESPHHSFGHDLVGQSWALDLDAAAQRGRR